MKKGLLSILVVCVVALLAIPACAPAKPSPAKPSVEPIKVGMNFSLTGSKAKFGEMNMNSATLAFSDFGIDRINDRPVKITEEDNRSEPATAKSAEEKLATANKVDLIIGGYSSSCTEPMTSAAEDLGIPHIIVTGSKDAITGKPLEWVFSGPRVPASHYGDAMWEFIDEVIIPGGVKKVALLYEMTDWGTSSAKSLRPKLEERGLEIVYDSKYNSEATDFKPMLSKVKAADPDMVIPVSYLTDAGLLVRQATGLELDILAWIGQAGGYTMPEFAELAGKDANLIFSTTNWNPKAAWEGTLNGIKWSGKKYSDEYVEKYDTEPDYHGAQGYAAGQIAVDALLRAAEAGNTINRESIRDALDNTDLTTVMGVIKHHKWTDEMGHHYYHQGLPPTYVIQWQDMAQEVVWPEDAASVDYIFPAPLLEQ